jgi:hypothetical protein
MRAQVAPPELAPRRVQSELDPEEPEAEPGGFEAQAAALEVRP